MKHVKLFENYVPDDWKKIDKEALIKKGDFIDYVGKAEEIKAFIQDAPEDLTGYIEKKSPTQLRIYFDANDKKIGMTIVAKDYGLFPVDLNSEVSEMKGQNKEVNKTKEIINNIRNIMMLKPDMTFQSIMYNALETTDTRELDDEDILKKLQGYEMFLKDALK